MSTFLGLLSGGRPPARYETYWLDGLGADTTTKKRAPAKKGGKKTAAKKQPAKKTAPKKVAVTAKIIRGLRNAPLDPHHNPFKRSSARPGGPAKRTTERSDQWTCEWRPGTATQTVQLCTAVGRTKKDGSPLTKAIKVNRKWKSEYNKAYHKHLKEIGKPKFKNEKHSFYEYRKTDWQARNPAKGRKKPVKKAASKKTSSRKKATAKA